MEKMKKVTKKDMFKLIAEVCSDNKEIVAFCEHEIELLDKKNSSSSKSKTQIENESIKSEILKALAEINRPVTISELQENNSEMAKYSNQKINALLKQLLEVNEIVRTVDKKKAYFSLSN